MLHLTLQEYLNQSYTPIGNIASTSFSGEYTYGETNYANPSAVTEIGTGLATTTYSYDNNGNLTGDGTWTYTWDYRNRLATSTATSTISYGYDHAGQRVRKTVGSTNTFYPNKYYNVSNATTTKHIFTPSGQLIATIEGNGIATTTNYVHTDHLGGTHVITNSSGQVIQTLQYYPFGKTRTNEQGTNFNEQRKFTGHEYDTESDLTYANARYYQQNIGRWISQDPASRDNPNQFLQDPQQLNYYSYSRNNPIVLLDSTGNATYYFANGTMVVGLDAWNKGTYSQISDAAMLQSHANQMAASGLGGDPIGLYEFYNLVKPGGEWDFKKDATQEGGGRGLYFFGDKLLGAEDFGNAHYGYVGVAGGLPSSVLFAGAGAAQIYKGTALLSWASTYFDDPRDQWAIQRGMDMARHGFSRDTKLTTTESGAIMDQTGRIVQDPSTRTGDKGLWATPSGAIVDAATGQLIQEPPK